MDVTGIDGKRHCQGDSGRTWVFKDVMGCTATHPPWLCKVFGRLPAGEREKLITDNRLCPFCLLHDKDKPCGAKQRPVPVACTAPNCRGRHIQKLHDFLKDVFREENQVHVVHRDDGWEESDEAWELGEEEMMIVGTVKQEDNCNWQDACNSWAEQEEEVAAGVYQVRACQGASRQPSVGQCKRASVTEGDEESLETEGLVLEGEEQEYFLELLTRTVSPERAKVSRPTGSKDDFKSEVVTKKKNKKKGRKAFGASKAKKEAGGQEKKEKAVNQASRLVKQTAPDLTNNPEAKGRGLVDGDQEKKAQVTGPQATSGGECSGQKTPDCS